MLTQYLPLLRENHTNETNTSNDKFTMQIIKYLNGPFKLYDDWFS
jgi:hypothetical protein